eukprot:scaffold4354_cov196-Ochromonas_danica.AAC.1
MSSHHHHLLLSAIKSSLDEVFTACGYHRDPSETSPNLLLYTNHPPPPPPPATTITTTRSSLLHFRLVVIDHDQVIVYAKRKSSDHKDENTVKTLVVKVTVDDLPSERLYCQHCPTSLKTFYSLSSSISL